MSKKTLLLEAIAALPEELVDQALTYVLMLQNPIQITPGVCGGQALAAEGVQKGLFVDTQTMRPKRLTPEERALFNPYLDPST